MTRQPARAANPVLLCLSLAAALLLVLVAEVAEASERAAGYAVSASSRRR